MNLLSPDDTVLTSALRRKSLCNGTIMGATASVVSGTTKKKDRARRGSLSEPPCRRASLVQRSVAQYFKCCTDFLCFFFYLIHFQILALNYPLFLRWVKHISDAADAFKSRTKGHHEHVEDAAGSAAAISNPSTKESLEETPEKEIIAGVGTMGLGSSSKNNSVDLFKENADDPLIETTNNRNEVSKRRLSGHTPAGNDDINDESGDDEDTSEHTEVKNRDDDISDDVVDVQQLRKREYSNNSNNTRTLTQQSSLVPPSEVQISVSPAMTAEPVLTPNGK